MWWFLLVVVQVLMNTLSPCLCKWLRGALYCCTRHISRIVTSQPITTAHVGLQDVLRLLTLWYRYGAFDDVHAELERGFKTVPVDTWLVAIPQLMARIHVEDAFIVKPLKDLLVKIGRIHPEALMHPLLVRFSCRLSPAHTCTGETPEPGITPCPQGYEPRNCWTVLENATIRHQ